ncbi:transmembrane protein 222-like [Artemia franciscana]|uniref:Transmembrane protein 222 n=1 Tax=Artemia franciscana TaxID=6661 RepID=A0AA88HR15_ARTSF|nr:hypothetical protein QYM36_012780 [Artemia franciscana]
MDMNIKSVEPDRNRYPHCIVWTPIPVLTWLFPIIGHMGIATTEGVIRDFAGPYYVNEERMAFGDPVKFWQLDLNKIEGKSVAYDSSISASAEEYKNHMHNLCCDNCHSFVALALNNMGYHGKNNWNMVSILFYFVVHSRYISAVSVLKTWVPFVLFVTLVAGLSLLVPK